MSTDGKWRWQLVGREAELSSVEAAFDTGRPAATIVGEAGVGKSHLAAALAARWEAAGANVERAIGTRSAATVPFGAVAHLIPEGPAPDDRLELLRTVTTELRNRSREAPSVLLVDDAHLLDPGSAALVHHAATTGAVFALATVRTGEPCEDAIRGLSKDGGGLHLSLAPMSTAEASQMLDAMLEGPIDIRTRNWILDRARGNPLSIRELVLGAVGSDALRQVKGVWKMDREPPPSGPLRDVIASRLEALDPAEHRAVSLLATAEPLEVEVLESLAGAETVTALERAALVEIKTEDAYQHVRFTHPLFGDVLRAHAGSREVAGLRAELATVYQERGLHRQGELIYVARWQMEADRGDPDVLVRGARAANNTFDRDLGERLAAAALDAGADFEAAVLLAIARTRTNRHLEAEAALEPYEEEASTAADASEYVKERFNVLHIGLGRSDDALALLQRARSWRPDRAWQEQLLAWEMNILLDLEQFEETVERGAALFEPGVDTSAMLTAAFPVPIALLLLGHADRARELSDMAVGPALERAMTEQQTSFVALGAWVAIAIETGHDWDSVDSFNTLATAAAEEWRNDELLGLMNFSRGALAMNRGLVRTAERELSRGVARFELSDPRGLRTVTQAMVAWAHALLGSVADAEEARRKTDAAVANRSLAWLDRVQVIRADVWIAAARGETSRAREIAVAGADELAHAPYSAASLLHDAVRVGGRDRALLDRLVATAALVDAPLIEAFGLQGQGLRDHDGGVLEEAGRRLEEMGALLFAAEAYAQAAEAYRGEGREDAARRGAATSRRLAALTEGARTPALADPVADDLTAREHEIAVLAARGESNQEIADRLVLSRRTVESHLYRVFAKLGVQQREDLGELIDN